MQTGQVLLQQEPEGQATSETGAPPTPAHQPRLEASSAVWVILGPQALESPWVMVPPKNISF